MRSINRVLALSALLAAAAAGSASAAWHPEKNGPRFGGHSAGATGVVSDEPISLAPKESVAEPRPFHPYSGYGAPSYASRCSNIKPFVRTCGHDRTGATETTTRGGH
jgi:hypothetical protein